jgi:SAM-dependent methyltransferase
MIPARSRLAPIGVHLCSTVVSLSLMDRDYAARYGSIEQWHWWFRARQRIIADVLRRELPDGRARRLCVVGCGPAEGVIWLREHLAAGGQLIGLDADPIHACVSDAGPTYVVGRLEAAPLASARMDLVLGLDVLEHIEDDAAALREMARLLAPDGLLLLAVPALPSLWGQQDTISHHRRRYTRASLGAAFARAGLTPPRLSYFNTLLLPLIAGVRWGRRALGRAERLQTDFDDNRPGLVNDALTQVFAAERVLLRRVALPFGVSLLALWRHPRSA